MSKLLYRVSEAAHILGISDREVYELASKGVLEKRFIGKGTRNYRIPADSLQRYAEGLPTEALGESA